MDAGSLPYERERLCQLIGAPELVFVKVDFIVGDGIVKCRQKPELPEQWDEAATSKGKSDAKTENPNAMFENQILKIGNPNAKRGE